MKNSQFHRYKPLLLVHSTGLSSFVGYFYNYCIVLDWIVNLETVLKLILKCLHFHWTGQHLALFIENFIGEFLS